MLDVQVPEEQGALAALRGGVEWNWVGGASARTMYRCIGIQNSEAIVASALRLYLPQPSKLEAAYIDL